MYVSHFMLNLCGNNARANLGPLTSGRCSPEPRDRALPGCTASPHTPCRYLYRTTMPCRLLSPAKTYPETVLNKPTKLPNDLNVSNAH